MSKTNRKSDWSPIHVLKNVENSEGEARSIQISRIIGLIPALKIDGSFNERFELQPIVMFSEHEVNFAPTTIKFNGRIGVTKVLIEWNDYQSECFGQLIYQHTMKKDDGSIDEYRNKDSYG